jgi:hypothetical protein
MGTLAGGCAIVLAQPSREFFGLSFWRKFDGKGSRLDSKTLRRIAARHPCEQLCRPFLRHFATA